MQGLVWFAFHFGIPHTLECCFQAQNGTICINTPPHYVWHALEMFVPNSLTPPLPRAGHDPMPRTVWCGLLSILGCPKPWNAVFKLIMVPYALTHHPIMYGMCACVSASLSATLFVCVFCVYLCVCVCVCVRAYMLHAVMSHPDHACPVVIV